MWVDAAFPLHNQTNDGILSIEIDSLKKGFISKNVTDVFIEIRFGSKIPQILNPIGAAR